MLYTPRRRRRPRVEWIEPLTSRRARANRSRRGSRRGISRKIRAALIVGLLRCAVGCGSRPQSGLDPADVPFTLAIGQTAATSGDRPVLDVRRIPERFALRGRRAMRLGRRSDDSPPRGARWSREDSRFSTRGEASSAAEGAPHSFEELGRLRTPRRRFPRATTAPRSGSLR